MIITIICLGLGCGYVTNLLIDLLITYHHDGSIQSYAFEEMPFYKDINRMIVQDYQYHFWETFPSTKNNKIFRVWVINITSLLFVGYLWFQFKGSLMFWYWWFMIIYFTIIFVIDLEVKRIYIPLSIIGIVIGLLSGIWTNGWLVTILGGILGWTLMLIIHYFGILFSRWARNIRAPQLPSHNALGFGDVNLALIIGLLLGCYYVLPGLCLGIILSAIGGLIILIRKLLTRTYQPFESIPLAPFMIISTLIMMIYASF